MAVDITSPSKFEFEHLLSHTLPGFFSAISLFMLLDIWSTTDLTLFVAKDLGNFASFIGFILFFGSILGIIIDGIHHSLIEDSLFDYQEGLKEIKDELQKQCFLRVGIKKEPNKKLFLTRHFFIDNKVEDYNKIHGDLVKNVYCYFEFYSNTFLSLILFSFVTPQYLMEILEFDPYPCAVISISSYVLACICLYSGYVAYKRYTQSLYSAIYSLVGNRSAASKTTTTTTTTSSTTTQKETKAIETIVENEYNYNYNGLDSNNIGDTKSRRWIALLILSTLLIFLTHMLYSPLTLQLGSEKTLFENRDMILSLKPNKIAINLTENDTYIEIITINNIGGNLTNITLEKAMYDLLNTENEWIESNIDPTSLNNSEIGFVRVKLNATNLGAGIYRCFIKIEGDVGGDRQSSEPLPVVLTIEPADRIEDIKLNFSCTNHTL